MLTSDEHRRNHQHQCWSGGRAHFCWRHHWSSHVQQKHWRQPLPPIYPHRRQSEYTGSSASALSEVMTFGIVSGDETEQNYARDATVVLYNIHSILDSIWIIVSTVRQRHSCTDAVIKQKQNFTHFSNFICRRTLIFVMKNDTRDSCQTRTRDTFTRTSKHNYARHRQILTLTVYIVISLFSQPPLHIKNKICIIYT